MKVLAVVGARLNSSRLPGKHLLDLAGKPMIARIFERLDAVQYPMDCVLATTADAYNQPLVDWCHRQGRAVYAHPHDVNDLMGRVDAVFEDHQPDVLVYICGDCPLLEPSFIDRVLGLLAATPQADYVNILTDGEARVIHQGMDIYPAQLWRQTVAATETAAHREHVGSARHDFLHTLKPIHHREPQVYYRSQQRISVDTPTDYRFMNAVYRRWYANHEGIVSLAWVIEELQRDKALAAMNAGVHQKAVGESSHAILLVGACGPQVGLGHLRRLLVLARALQDGYGAGVRLLLLGTSPGLSELALLPHHYCEDLLAGLDAMMAEKRPEALVFDLPRRLVPEPLQKRLQRPDTVVVNIDGSLPWPQHCELNHVPSFYLDPSHGAAEVHHGWDAYLLERTATPLKKDRVLVLTGGSDTLGMGAVWPALLAAQLPAQLEVVWVCGPYASEPVIPEGANIRVLHAPEDLNTLMAESKLALVVYGVSLFECLAHETACVTLVPSWAAGEGEFQALREQGVVLATRDPAEAISLLAQLAGDSQQADALVASNPIDGRGGDRLAARIMGCLREA